jgi:hypothetical protein
MSMVIDAGIGSADTQPNEASDDCHGHVQDRRSRPRIKVHWPGVLFPEDSTERIETVTQDLSSTGLYCLVPLPFLPCGRFTGILKMPAYDPTDGSPIRNLKCKLRLVRVEPPRNGEVFAGAAFAIEDYHLLVPSHE